NQRAGRARLVCLQLRRRCSVTPPVTLRALRAGRTSAVLDVAGAVLIHVLDGEVTRTVLVQIPAMQTMSALRALVTLGALRAGVEIGTASGRECVTSSRTGRARA